MDLKDIKDLMKVLKSEEMAELKLKYGKIELTLVNSDDENIETLQNVQSSNNIVSVNDSSLLINREPAIKEEIIKSLNVGTITFANNIEKGMEVSKGMLLAKITTLNVVNDVKAPESGKLKDILVADNSLVDYGKSIFVIEM